MPLSEDQLAVLICPDCREPLSDLRCIRCHVVFEENAGQVDLRPRRSHRVHVEVSLGEQLPEVQIASTLPLGSGGVSGLGSLPLHLTEELVSHFPAASAPSSLMLDLGCGSGQHRPVAEMAGYQYTGVDYANDDAPILADAHRLPFADNSFEFAISVAVFEHLRWPMVAAAEIARVLQPGGAFVGTIAFAEPFHGDSLYHHTHLGVINTLSGAGFEIVHLGAHPQWTVLDAYAKNALFPGLPERLRRWLVQPTRLLHETVWLLRGLWRRSEDRRLRKSMLTAGAWSFVARIPTSSADGTE